MPYTENMRITPFSNELLRSGHTELARRIKPELFLTLATNQHISIDRMKGLVKRFLRDMDQALLGRRFMHCEPERRLDGLLYVEHEHSNIHVHGLMTRPYCNQVGLQLHAERIWSEMCQGGSVVIKAAGDFAKRSEYCTKEFRKQDFFERQFFTARELMAAA